MNECTPAILSLFRTITAASLSEWPQSNGSRGGRHRRRLSTLTPDGLPLEVSVSIAIHGGTNALRYSTEGTHPCAPLSVRLRQADRAVAGALELLGATGRRPLNRKLLATLSRGGLARESRFLIWIGLSHGSDDDLLKLYYNLQPRKDANTIFSRWLDVVAQADGGPCLARLLRKINAKSVSAVPAFVCLEIGRGGGPLKAKAYYRSPTPLDRRQSEDLLNTMGLGRFVESYKGCETAFHSGRVLPLAPKLFSIGLSFSHQQPSVNFYYDMARHVCDDDAAREAIGRMIDWAGLSKQPYLEVLELLTKMSPLASEAGAASKPRFHTVLALGFNPDGTKMTPYMKPHWPEFV